MKRGIMQMTALFGGLFVAAQVAHADCSGFNPCDSNDIWWCCSSLSAEGIDPYSDPACVTFSMGGDDLLCVSSGGSMGEGSDGGGMSAPPAQSNCQALCTENCDAAADGIEDTIKPFIMSCLDKAYAAYQACGLTPACVSQYMLAQASCQNQANGLITDGKAQDYQNVQDVCNNPSLCDPNECVSNQ